MNEYSVKTILFVSSGHVEPCMTAAALATSVAGKDWEVFCASDSKSEMHPMVISTLEAEGLQVPQITPQHPKELVSERFDVVVSFCKKSVAMCPAFAGLPAHFHWPLDELIHCSNPTSRECFKRLYAALKERIKALFDHDTLNVVTHLRSNLGALVDHLTDGVMAHDDNRTIFVFNKAAEKITGYSVDEVIGRDCHEVFPGLLCGGHCSFCEGDVTPDKKIRYPSQFVHKSGNLRDLEMSAITIHPQGQRSQGTLVIFRDLTEMKQLKRNLRSTKGFHGIIGQHPSIKKVFQVVEEIAGESVPVLIQGESGTGKELIARALHRLSPRKDHPLVPVNCSALPEGVLESELFGHVKGAFTGAIADKRGRFELANRGTLFLDEIGEISQAIQVKLLRVLEDQKFVPVGGEKEKQTDIRIICATNKDLYNMTQEGDFRDDLYYRLAVYPIWIPPLRDRVSDIPLLTDCAIASATEETGRSSARMVNEAMQIFKAYHWPGNVRQLMNVIQYALIRSRGNEITPNHLPDELLQSVRPSRNNQAGRPKKLTSELVTDTLTQFDGNIAKTARELGIARSTLYRYLPKNQSDNTYV